LERRPLVDERREPRVCLAAGAVERAPERVRRGDLLHAVDHVGRRRMALAALAPLDVARMVELAVEALAPGDDVRLQLREPDPADRRARAAERDVDQIVAEAD